MAAGNIKGITIEIGGDTTKLGEALKDADKNSRSLQAELKQVERLLKLDPSNTELVAQKQKLLKDAVNETKTKLDTLKEAEQQVQEQFERGEVSEQQYRSLQREIVATEQQLKKLEDEAKNSNDTLAKVSDAVGKVGEKSQKLGEALTPVSAAAAAVGAAAVASTMDLDKGYDTIITATGATGDALEGLKESADNVFTNMPADMDDVGAAIGEVNTRFGSTGTELENLSTKFLQFAEINGTDVTSSIASVDKIMQAWNVDSSQTGDLMGMITAKAQETGIGVDTLMSSVLENNSTFKEMGLTLEESINLMASFEKNGVNSTTALAGLKKAVANYTEQGMSMDEALGATIDSIKNASSETEALSIATEIFGTKGAAEMTNAIREGRISVDDLAGSMSDYGTVVEDTFNATQDPWDEAKIALNNIKLAASELGATLLTTLQPIITAIIDKVKSATEWFKGLSDGQKEMIAKAVLIVAALAPVLLIISKLCTGIQTVISTVKMLQPVIAAIKAAMLANPVAFVIAGIVALIAILVTLYNNCEGFRNMVNAFFEGVKAGLAIVIEVVGAYLQQVWADLQNLWLLIQPFLLAAWEAIKAIWSQVAPYFQAIWDTIVIIFSVVVDVLGGYFSMAWEVIKAVWDVVTSYFQAIWDTIAGIFAVVQAVLSGDWQGAWDAIKGIVDSWAGYFSSIWEAIKSIFSAVTGWFGDTFSAAWDAVKRVFDTWGGFFSGLWDTICNTFSGLGTALGNAIGGAVKSAINGVISWIESTINSGISLINGAISLINKLPGVSVGSMGYLSLPRLAKGGTLREGQAMVAEAGPELLQMVNGKAVVTPLSGAAKNRNIDELKGGTQNSINLNIEKFVNEREEDIQELTERILEIADDIKEREEAAYA